MPVDLFSSSVAFKHRNIFAVTCAVPAAVERARSLRGHASHGEIPSPPRICGAYTSWGTRFLYRSKQSMVVKIRCWRIKLFGLPLQQIHRRSQARMQSFLQCQQHWQHHWFRPPSRRCGSRQYSGTHISTCTSIAPVSCLVPGYPGGLAGRTAGWTDVSGMRDHLNDHCVGTARFFGAIPPAFLEQKCLGQ